ncbi:MAG TPA: DivIVA domain-containing protein [Mycobacterium sp.]|nr:DivIVA domain-containing protein [Mycobacterium sp.]
MSKTSETVSCRRRCRRRSRSKGPRSRRAWQRASSATFRDQIAGWNQNWCRAHRRDAPTIVGVTDARSVLTVDDVRNVVFGKPPLFRRGYDEEVDKFLDLVTVTIAALELRRRSRR